MFDFEIENLLSGERVDVSAVSDAWLQQLEKSSNGSNGSGDAKTESEGEFSRIVREHVLQPKTLEDVAAFYVAPALAYPALAIDFFVEAGDLKLQGPLIPSTEVEKVWKIFQIAKSERKLKVVLLEYEYQELEKKFKYDYGRCRKTSTFTVAGGDEGRGTSEVIRSFATRWSPYTFIDFFGLGKFTSLWEIPYVFGAKSDVAIDIPSLRFLFEHLYAPVFASVRSFLQETEDSSRSSLQDQPGAATRKRNHPFKHCGSLFSMMCQLGAVEAAYQALVSEKPEDNDASNAGDVPSREIHSQFYYPGNWTALHLACRLMHVDLVKEILERVSDPEMQLPFDSVARFVNHRDENGDGPFHVVLTCHELLCVTKDGCTKLLDTGFQGFQLPNYEFQLLRIRYDDEYNVRCCQEGEAQYKSSRRRLGSPTMENVTEILEELLRCRLFDLNLQNALGKTPIHAAAALPSLFFPGPAWVIDRILEASDNNATRNRNGSPEAENAHHAAAQLSVVDPNLVDHSGETILWCALRSEIYYQHVEDLLPKCSGTNLGQSLMQALPCYVSRQDAHARIIRRDGWLVQEIARNASVGVVKDAVGVALRKLLELSGRLSEDLRLSRFITGEIHNEFVMLVEILLLRADFFAEVSPEIPDFVAKAKDDARKICDAVDIRKDSPIRIFANSKS